MNGAVRKLGHLSVDLSSGVSAFKLGDVALERDHFKVGVSVGGMNDTAFSGAVIHIIGTTDDYTIDTKSYTDMDRYYEALTSSAESDLSGSFSVKLRADTRADQIVTAVNALVESFGAIDVTTDAEGEIAEAIEDALAKIGAISVNAKVSTIAARHG